MDLRSAQQRIDEVFTPDVGDPNLQPEEYLELLAPIAALPDEDLVRAPRQARKFLYYGSRTFDRWSPPTPVVVDVETTQHYRDFIGTFRRCEPSHPNLPVFALHELQTEVFERWGSRSVDLPSAVEPSALEDIRRRAREVAVPSIPQLQVAVEDARRRIEVLCDAVERGDVQSAFTVQLPHAVVHAPHRGRGTWRGRQFSYRLNPDAANADGWTAGGDAVVGPVGLTRADSGTCSATVVLESLEDFNASSPRLTGDPVGGLSRSASEQPWCQSVVFYLLTELIEGLQDSSSPYVDRLWVLTPRDISQLSVQIRAGEQSVVNIPFLSLGGWRVTAGPLDAQIVDFGLLRPTRYWIVCRRRAEGYLSLGANHEALLWLNMATEALLDERIDNLTEGRPELRQELTIGSKLLFAEAEAAVAEQFPAMAGRVAWPDRVQAPSRFAQIKALCRGVPLPIRASDALSKYSIISKNRNAVIHGRDVGRVSPSAVSDGLEALDWLAQHLRPPPAQDSTRRRRSDTDVVPAPD